MVEFTEESAKEMLVKGGVEIKEKRLVIRSHVGIRMIMAIDYLCDECGYRSFKKDKEEINEY
jgi:hypothetical protein